MSGKVIPDKTVDGTSKDKSGVTTVQSGPNKGKIKRKQVVENDDGSHSIHYYYYENIKSIQTT